MSQQGEEDGVEPTADSGIPKSAGSDQPVPEIAPPAALPPSFVATGILQLGFAPDGLTDELRSAEAEAPIEPPPARRRPARSTVIVAVASVIVAACGLGGMWMLRTNAYADRMPGPSAEVLVAEFARTTQSGSEKWASTATPELVATFTEPTSTPFLGIDGVLTSADISVAVSPTNTVSYRAGDDATSDPTLADEATAGVRVTYTLADRTTVSLPVALSLTRTFTAGDDESSPESASPWRVSAMKSGTPVRSDVSVPAVCDSPTALLMTLSTGIRKNASLDLACTRDGDPTSWLPEGADPVAWLAEFPVYDEYSLPTDAAHQNSGIAQFPVMIGEKPVVAIVAQAHTSDGKTGWALLQTVEVAP